MGAMLRRTGPGPAIPALLFLVAVVLLVPAPATSLSLAWESAIGGPGDEGLAWLAPLPDGGLLLAGNTSTDASGGSDILLVRTDDGGAAVQTARFGTGPVREQASTGVLFPDGGAAIAGVAKSGARAPALHLLRVDPRLDLLWERTYPAASGLDAAYGVARLADGGLLVLAGRSTGGLPSLLLIRLEPDGSEEWRRTLVSRPGLARAGLLARLPDGGFLVAGADDRALQHDLDLFVVRLDNEGRSLWERSYPDPASNALPSAVGTATGRVVVVAGAAEGLDGLRMFATALDPFGRAAWTWAGSPVDGPVEVGAVVLVDDSCLVIGSSAVLRGEAPHLALIELGQDGTERSRYHAPADAGAERGRAAAVMEGRIVLGIEARSEWTHGTDLLLRSVSIGEGPATVATAATRTPDRSPARTIPSPNESETGTPSAPLSLLAGIGACGAAAFLIRRR